MGTCLNKALIFDFDGTLVDSEQAIYECFKRITKQLAPKRIEYTKNILIGPPLRETASEILGPENQDSLDEFVQLFIKMHDDEITKHTKPYPGTMHLFEKAKKNKIPIALATNKRQVPTLKLIDYFKWDTYFNIIKCSDSDEEIIDKNTMIYKIINQDERFKSSYFIGDTMNDGLSANKNNLNFIKANYGYGKNQKWTDINITAEIDDIYDLIKFLKL